jgi:phosphatidate cytidylyltransferase
MKRVLTAVVLIPLVLLVLFLAPAWLFAAFILLIAVISTREYLALLEGYGILPFRRWTLAGATAILLAAGVTVTLLEYSRNQAGGSPERWQYAWDATQAVPVLFLSLPFLFLIQGLRRGDLKTVLPGAAASTFALIYPVLPLLLVLFLRWTYPAGATLLLYMFLTVWSGDIAAYYVGRTFGRRRLAPLVSPQKSWEGALASLLLAATVGALILNNLPAFHLLFYSEQMPPERIYFRQSPNVSLPIWVGLLLSAGLNLAAQLGDLVESMLKRGAGVKDSGTLLPGHGGMLDRIDALLFAAPVLWYYLIFRLIPL